MKFILFCLCIVLITTSAFSATPPSDDLKCRGVYEEGQKTGETSDQPEVRDFAQDLQNDLESCRGQGSCTPTSLSQKIAAGIQKHFRVAKGYATLLAIMIGSAALNGYLVSHWPQHLYFFSFAISQAAYIGINVFGSSIIEPIQSKFRKTSFDVSAQKSEDNGNPNLLPMWPRTNRLLSLNEQMSRNIILSSITSMCHNFDEAYWSMREGDQDRAADQIAEAAFRQRLLIKDLAPNDPSVVASIKSAFVHHIPIDDSFESLVRKWIGVYDPVGITTAPVSEYYNSILKNWLH